MADVAVLHNTLDFQGGADVVCLEVCDLLAADHDVSLFTVSETGLADLAERFDRPIPDVEVRTPPGADVLARTLSRAAPWIGPQLALRSVLLERLFRPHAEDFDFAVSTANEFALPIPSVQYVHYPQFHLARADRNEPSPLNRLWSRLSGPPRIDDDTTVLANSAWTAAVFEEIYGRRPAVVHPPVDPIDCDSAWSEREPGIVVVGRIAPDKRIEAAIRVVEGVRERGHDVHLHIAGSAPRSYRRYVERIARMAATRPYVHLETDVPRRRIRELLCGHRFGLNCKEDEHFGMTVAEYVTAGMLAFAPASGGQQEILDHRSDRLFESTAEAADLVADAIEGTDRPTAPRDRFQTREFRSKFRQHLRETQHSSHS